MSIPLTHRQGSFLSVQSGLAQDAHTQGVRAGVHCDDGAYEADGYLPVRDAQLVEERGHAALELSGLVVVVAVADGDGEGLS